MSQQDRDSLKSYFKTDDIPTEDNFAALIDSCLNLMDTGISSAAAGQLALQSQINQPITGTLTTTTGSATITGTGTRFQSEVTLNGPLMIGGTRFTVVAVASDTSLTVAPAVAVGANNVTAMVDPGAALWVADASGNVQMQLSKAVLNVPVGIATATLTATGQVSAAVFSGSGANLSAIPVSAISGAFSPAQLPSIPAAKITGALNIAQLPSIPASQITGQLAAAQLPAIVGVAFYTPAPCIGMGANAQLSWLADPAYDLQLDYVDRGTAMSMSSTNGALTKGSGNITAKIVQSTAFTLTVSSNGQFVAMRQVWVEVMPTPIQKAMQLQFEGYSTNFAVGMLARRFGLTALTVNNVTTLAQALNTAAFPQGEIFQSIPAYFIDLNGPGSFTQPFMTAMFRGANQ